MKILKTMLVRTALALLALMPMLDGAHAVSLPPLLQAASEGKTEAVARLIKAGADPDTRAADGRTALMHAATNGHFDTVRALMINGAHKELTDNAGRTAFDYAFEKKYVDIIALLRDAS
jgi:ankyrin repeat protein